MIRRTRSTLTGLFLTITVAGMLGAQDQTIAAMRPLQAGDTSHQGFVTGGDAYSLMPSHAATVEDDLVAALASVSQTDLQELNTTLSASVPSSTGRARRPVEIDVDISKTVIPNDDPSALAETGSMVHHVRSGETLLDISKRYKVSVDDLIKVNSIKNPSDLSANDVLRIPAHLLDQAEESEQAVSTHSDHRLALKSSDLAATLESQATDFRVSPDVEAPEIARRTILPQVTALELPPLESSDTYLPSKTFKMPTGSFSYIWPAQGVFTSGYGPRWGRMHRGIDIAAPVGTTVVASAPGIVQRAGWNSGGYGNLVEIRHPDGSSTRYAHNNRIVVKKGQPVNQGEKIAEMGSTGRSTGPHTHFEIRKPSGNAVNPIKLLKKRS